MKKEKINAKKFSIIILTVLLIVVLTLLAIKFVKDKKENEAIPVISLIGKSNIELKLNEEYQENGAVATLNDKDVTNKIEKVGEVDNSKIGKYEIKYLVTNNKNKNRVEVTRIVNVIDTIKPEIKLNGDQEVTLYVGNDYKEQGASAIDNYDGDITSKIVISGEVNNQKAGEYKIKYYIQDSSANVAEITRSVIVKEKLQATAQLGKGLPILMYHFFYDEKVSDGRDGNWISISKFEEQMKYLSENGYYFPTWKEVEDYIDGKIDLPNKSVVITVDDGDPTFFELAVPIIKKYNVRATSFVIAAWYGWSAIEYKSDNVDIQSHTYDMHKPGTEGKGIFLSKSYEEALKDIKQSQEVLKGATVLAYPFGHYNDVAKKVLKDAGVRIALTTQEGRVYKGTNKLELPRVRINKWTNLNKFINLVK